MLTLTRAALLCAALLGLLCISAVHQPQGGLTTNEQSSALDPRGWISHAAGVRETVASAAVFLAARLGDALQSIHSACKILAHTTSSKDGREIFFTFMADPNSACKAEVEQSKIFKAVQRACDAHRVMDGAKGCVLVGQKGGAVGLFNLPLDGKVSNFSCRNARQLCGDDVKHQGGSIGPN